MHRALNQQFGDRQAQKTYVAVVHGVVPNDDGRIDRPLREFGSGRVAVDRRGKPSTTLYEVRERLGGFTLLVVRPLTGRRHQIRAHQYSIGHAVAGDRRYGERLEAQRLPRLMLHASDLALPRPGGAELRVTSPVPESFAPVVSSLREERGSVERA
jgi:tRNA pseudouridine32 synthase / 23S rRNA pseudouridine746 synthase